jgi:hypothetical protein
MPMHDRAMRRASIFVLISCAGLAPALAQSASEVFPSPRLAAVAYAVAHGFEIPRTNIVLANEIETGQFSHGRGSPNDRARSLPVGESLRDSRAVAAMLGPGVRTAPVAEIVSCPERRCFASTKAHALLVDDLKDDSTGVYIKLYSPGTGAGDRGTLLHAIVNTAKTPTGWTATGFSTGPTRIILR